MTISDTTNTVLKYLTTAAACLVYVAEGIVFTVPEPTLLQIRDVAGTSIAGISLVFSIRSVGGLMSSLITGFVMKNWRRDILIGVLTIIMALAIGIVPWCTNLPVMLCAFFFQGYGIGYIETNANVLVKDIWLDDSAPALQALYLFFLVGSFFAPLMGIPFLGSYSENQPLSIPRTCAILDLYGHLKEPFDPSSSQMAIWCRDLIDARIAAADAMDLPSLKKFYVMVAFICTVIGIIMVLFGVVCERFVLQGTYANSTENMPDKQQKRWVTVSILLLITISGGLFIGAELNYAGFLATFVIMQLHRSSAHGIYITSMFWGVYTVAAVIGVALAKFVRAAKMMFVCGAVMTLGLVILSAWGDVTLVTWIGTAIFALGCSSTYGGIFVLADEYVTLTSAVSAVVVCGTTVGEFIVPLISGQVFELNPMSLMYLTLACILTSDIGFIAMELIVKKYGIYTAVDNADENIPLKTMKEEHDPLLANSDHPVDSTFNEDEGKTG